MYKIVGLADMGVMELLIEFGSEQEAIDHVRDYLSPICVFAVRDEGTERYVCLVYLGEVWRPS